MKEAGKPLLVWDIDDVLNSLTSDWLRDGSPAACRQFPYRELRDNPPLQQLGLTRHAYLESLDAFREEQLYQLPPRPETLAFFRQYGPRFRHLALSSVPLRFAEESARWVLHWFGAWIQGVCFIPSPRPGVELHSQLFASKGEALRQFGTDALLIDDSPCNAESVRSFGGQAVLFPAPWNKNRDLSAADFFSSLFNCKP